MSIYPDYYGDGDRRQLPDMRRSRLGDSDHSLLIAVDADGNWWPWVITAGLQPGDACSDCPPAHEKLGKLPGPVRRRLGMVCGAPTRWGPDGKVHRGQTCSRLVDRYGDRCRQHQEDS